MNLASNVLPLALTLVPLLPGCLIGSHSHTENVGRSVSATTLAQIQPGKSKAYVLALIGEPTVRTTVDEHTEVWKWSCIERKDSSGHVIFLINADSRTETERTTFVEFYDDSVVRAWNG